jgi:hypothetical protein
VMRTWNQYICPFVVHEVEKRESNKGFQVKKERC